MRKSTSKSKSNGKKSNVNFLRKNKTLKYNSSLICNNKMRKGEKKEKEINFRNAENIIPFTRYQMYRFIYDYNSIKKNQQFEKRYYKNYIVKSDDNSMSLSLEKIENIIEHFWTALSLCHTCTVELNEKDIEEYICVSPDSIELVKTAKAQGWEYEESGNPNIKLVKVGDFAPTKKKF